MPRTTLVVATRHNREDFFNKSATGRSITACRASNLDLRVFTENRRGLPACYNEALRESRGKDCNMVFAHDDLLLLDFFWVNRIEQGLAQFDLIGLAGNKRRVPNQSGWMFVDAKRTKDSAEHLSGVVGHGDAFPPKHLSFYGPTGQPVKLLDGLLLAGHNRTFMDHDVWFDESFDFHFYDMDICRQAEQKGLRCGTWPISLVHASGGKFSSADWEQAYATYIRKWGD